MLSTQYVQPIVSQSFEKEVDVNIRISAKTEFMLKELAEMFNTPPETGCKIDAKDD